jgi:hypothetical protein
MSTEAQTVPDQHSSVVGGSNAARRIACPASLGLERQVPDDPGSTYAQEGTVLHEIMTKLLLDPDLEPDDILPFKFTHADGWTYTVDADTWYELGQPALDAFLDYVDALERDEDAELYYEVEQRCEFPNVEGAYGTADIVWRCGTIAGVWDWKFGYGKVSAKDNAQLLFYAAAARNSHPALFAGADRAELAIMQPQRCDEPDVWQIDLPDQLDDFVANLQAAVAEAQGDDPRMERGDHCKWAKCKAICPLHVDPTVQLAQKLAAVKDNASEGDRLGDDPTFREMLPDLLELAEIAQSYAGAVFSEAHSLAEREPETRDDLRASGWVLKDKKPGPRKWAADEKTITRGARYRGLKIDEFAPRKLVSPRQLEQQLKKYGKEMPEKWAVSPPSAGTTLTRDAEGVEEHRSASDKTRALGERLSHLRGR